MFSLVLSCWSLRYLAGCPIRVQVFNRFAKPSGDSGRLSSLVVTGMERGWLARVGSVHSIDQQYFFLSSDMGAQFVWILRQVRNFCRFRWARDNRYFSHRRYRRKLVGYVT